MIEEPVIQWVRAGTYSDPFKKSLEDVISLLERVIDVKKEEIQAMSGDTDGLA